MSIDQDTAPLVSTQGSPKVNEAKAPDPAKSKKKPQEIGGPPGPEPTRYGDWQFNGRVTDF